MRNVLLETIREALKDTHIEGGRKDEFDRECLRIEDAISKKIIAHEIDYYTEIGKLI